MELKNAMAGKKKLGAAGTARDAAPPAKRQYLSQSAIPRVPLSQALRIPRAIADNYSKAPTKPLRVAEALEMTTSSGTFRDLCGASIAYGLTEGGAYSDVIALTPLGRRVVAPTRDGDDVAAMREAGLKPQLISGFLNRYNDNRLPPDKIAHNVLEEMGVPRERIEKTYSLILQTAQDLGFLREIKGNRYVDLEGVAQAVSGDSENLSAETEDANGSPNAEEKTEPGLGTRQGDSMPVTSLTAPVRVDNSRVFITHGKNKDIVSQLKDLLSFGKFDPIVSVDRETVSKPVSEKVLDDMRSCYAAIIHVGGEQKMMDAEGKEQVILNPNVLIEIGAAMALYQRRFILLVERGVALPSNLQGLYEVRYEGDRLDYDATMKLLRAFNDFRG